ncbi:hypothetical protein ACF8O9_03285 [Stenotrophomonas geniculata]|uniref:hypothetical protein n=1 Tax=Stenotrophomonas TaxID=40323 RepID=UPI002114D51E|nr:hypothetical protein [Stenotrophomonas sp. 9(2022)]
MTQRERHDQRDMSRAITPSIRLMLAILLVWQLSSLAVSSGFSLRILRTAFQPFAGELESLPPAVGEFAHLLRTQSAAPVTCSLSDEVASDSLLMQRSYEAIYPVRIDSSSRSCILGTESAAVASSCRLEQEGEHARIFNCR